MDWRHQKLTNPWRVLVDVEGYWPGVTVTEVRTKNMEPDLKQKLLEDAVEQVIDLSETVRVLRLALEKVSRDIGRVPDTSIQFYIKKTEEAVKLKMKE
jgi:hypothetical protein